MTWSQTWIGMGVFSWVIGFIRAGRVSEIGSLVNRTFVRPPLLVYIICGMPRAKNIPKGVMAIPALLAQLQGLLWILYGLVSFYLPLENLILHGALLFIGTVLILAYGWTLYKHYKVE